MDEMADCLETLMADTSVSVTAVCGNNQKLYESLASQFQIEIDTERLTLYGFTRNIRDLMDSHDCMMSKPGGLTTTEAILRQVPMLIPFMIPGQEAENTEFLVQEGMALQSGFPDELAEKVAMLENQPHRLPMMRARMQNVARGYSPAAIFALSAELIQTPFREGRHFQRRLRCRS